MPIKPFRYLPRLIRGLNYCVIEFLLRQKESTCLFFFAATIKTGFRKQAVE